MSEASTGGGVLEGRLRQALDRYFLLLLMILITIAATALIVPEGWGALLLVGLQSSTALLAVSTSDSPRVTRVLVRVLSSVAVSLVALSALSGSSTFTRGAFTASVLVLVAIVPVTVLRRLARHRRVTIQTVMGVLCVYLLVGLLYAVFYASYQHFTGQFFQQTASAGPADFIYFSFTTVTTVGFGDFVPKGDAARILAVSEALIGQLYLVTVVALTVSNIGLEARERDREARRGPVT